ncbi:MAG: hypothetical protein O2967_01910 [Proteobacteria bacterium]|nr:hypothetical protein [Pseudomonadota bacterium]
MSEVHVREIADTDIAEVCALLAEGLRPSNEFWRNAVHMLSRRPVVEGYARYGFCLDVDGRLEGVLLLLTARVDGIIRSNLSSWYVREPHRKFASFLYQRTIRTKGSVYLNLSPSPAALPIAKAFGFKPYTGGMLLLDARSALKMGDASVRPLTQDLVGGLDVATRGMVEAHLGYGCTGLLLHDAAGPMVALYRIRRLKRLIPAARFVAGDSARLAKASGALMRAVLRRGLPLCIIDAPVDYPPAPGAFLFPGREMRYAKGGTPPGPGDLRETELALFDF